MADEFLEDGKLIFVPRKNKKGKINRVFATEKVSFEDKPHLCSLMKVCVSK